MSRDPKAVAADLKAESAALQKRIDALETLFANLDLGVEGVVTKDGIALGYRRVIEPRGRKWRLVAAYAGEDLRPLYECTRVVRVEALTLTGPLVEELITVAERLIGRMREQTDLLQRVSDRIGVALGPKLVTEAGAGQE